MLMESPQTKTDVYKLAAQADEIEKLFAYRNVRLPNCTLTKWIANIRTIVARLKIDPNAGHMTSEYFQAVQLYRVVEPILALREIPYGHVYLRKITENLDTFNGERSQAKDIFWELELWWLIRRRHALVALLDPPDIMLALHEGSVGIACKCVYSEASVKKALQSGVRQVKGVCTAGVVAFNVDTLIPPDSIVRAQGKEGVDRLLHPITDSFLERHKPNIHRYMKERRLAGVIVAVNGIGDIHGWGVPFNIVRSSVIYAANWPGELSTRLVRQLHGVLDIA